MIKNRIAFYNKGNTKFPFNLYSAPRYGRMWGNGGIAPRILKLDTRWR
jgi:hypothetical protein